MTPRQVLASHTARDMAEWEAYERVAGPVGPPSSETLGALHDAVVSLLRYTQLVHTPEEDRNKIPEYPPYPRPSERRFDKQGEK